VSQFKFFTQVTEHHTISYSGSSAFKFDPKTGYLPVVSMFYSGSPFKCHVSVYFLCFPHRALSLYEETHKCTYESCTLFIDHTYTFLSPYASILRVYSIKEYNKKLCVANLSKI
jgi:hypothetical protein